MKKIRARRITTLLLALALLVGLCPMAPKAEAVTVAETCPCCGVPVSQISWTEISGSKSFKGGHYRLTGTVWMEDYILIEEDTTIDFNGYKIYGEYEEAWTRVYAQLNLMDLSEGGAGGIASGFDVGGYRGQVGELNLYSGTISECEYIYSSLISVYQNGTLNVSGGKIIGTYAEASGGAIDNQGTVNISGGEITGGGTAWGDGGNIYNTGTLNISGGAISGGNTNEYGCYGGNIYNAGTATISGGIITGGRVYCGYGGNIYNEGTLEITGGTISDGVLVSDWEDVYGGNIYNSGLLNIYGGTISGGTVEKAYEYDDWYYDYSGTNIYNRKTMNMYGGTVTSAENRDLGVSSGAKLTIYGGRYEGKTNITSYLADCCCYTKDTAGYTILHAGYEDRSCGDDCEYAALVETGKVQHVPGGHTYVSSEGMDLVCSACGKAKVITLCPCCGVNTDDISWTAISGSVSFGQAGHYQLSGNYTLAMEYTITADVVIDLNGYTLTAKNSTRAFTVGNGGNLTIVNTVGKTGSLVGKEDTAHGGTIKVEAGGTLTLYSGRIVGSDVGGKNGGAIYSDGTVKIYGGTVEAGAALKGGNIYSNSGELLLAGGIITGGKALGDGGNGGNIFNVAKMTITGGTVEDGTSGEHGGNIYNTSASSTYIYGGTISGGQIVGDSSDSDIYGHGGNIYNTGKNNQFHMYGGTVTGGQNLTKGRGGNIAFNTGAQGHIYGGTVENGMINKGKKGKGGNIAVLGSSSGQFSALYILGGTFIAAEAGDFDKGNDNIIKIYSCRYNGTTDILPWLADCTCYNQNDEGITVWNAGYEEGTCTDCLYGQARAEGTVELVGGEHNYAAGSNGTFVCTICGREAALEGVEAVVNGTPYPTLKMAVDAAGEGDVIQLCADVNLSYLYLRNNKILDLNGYTLTLSWSLTATAGNIIDTSEENTGKVVCDSISISGTNQNVPVEMEDGVRFSPVGFTQWVETVDENTTKVKFYFTQRDNQTLLDDAILSGSNQIDVLIYLTWTDAQGQTQEKLVSFGSTLVQKYAEKWNGRVFVATITGTAAITDLKVTYQVQSTAISGATVSGKTVTVPKYINDKLTWDKINSFPIKTSDMTVEEMRQLCVDFMEFTKTYVWTPSEGVDYIRNASGSKDSMSQGTIYGGLPYVGIASGNVYRMMDYISEFGIVDMKKALPMLGTKDRLEYADLKYFGSQCSESVYWAWGRVMNSANYKWTSSVVPANNFVLVGDIEIQEIEKWTAEYNTKMACQENGSAKMYEAYAQLQKADGMVNYVETTDGDGAGHLVMVYKDAEVVYKANGTIDGDKSYIYIIDQAQSWKTATNAAGDIYQYKNSVGEPKTFKNLYDSGYIPFTFEEFLGKDDIEITEVSLVSDTDTLVSGTISEEDRSFQAAATTDKLTWSQLMSSSITSNYGVVDAYIIIKDNAGNEIYKHAVRTATAGNMSLAMEESGEMVTTWVTKEPKTGRTYNAEIVVQLATGERPTIWNGKLTIDK